MTTYLTIDTLCKPTFSVSSFSHREKQASHTATLNKLSYTYHLVLTKTSHLALKYDLITALSQNKHKATHDEHRELKLDLFQKEWHSVLQWSDSVRLSSAPFFWHTRTWAPTHADEHTHMCTIRMTLGPTHTQSCITTTMSLEACVDVFSPYIPVVHKVNSVLFRRKSPTTYSSNETVHQISDPDECQV